MSREAPRETQKRGRSRSPDGRESKASKGLTRAELDSRAETVSRKSRLELLRQMQGGGSDEEDDDDGHDHLKTQSGFSELDEEQQLKAMFGFEGFDSTKGKKVDTNYTTAAKGAMAKTKRREHRQYMNRKIIRKDGGIVMQGHKGKGFGGKGGKGAGGFGGRH